MAHIVSDNLVNNDIMQPNNDEIIRKLLSGQQSVNDSGMAISKTHKSHDGGHLLAIVGTGSA